MTVIGLPHLCDRPQPIEIFADTIPLVLSGAHKKGALAGFSPSDVIWGHRHEHSQYMAVSLNGGKTPKMDGENRNILLKWMIWGYIPLFLETPI